MEASTIRRISNNRFKELKKLTQKKYIAKEELVIVEGHRVLAQLKANGMSPIELYVSDKAKQVESMFSYGATIVYLLTETQLSTITDGKNNQSIAGLYKCSTQKFPEKWNNIVYLDNISEPGNLGTIIRTALALDIEGVVLSPGCCSIWNPKVIRASMGAVFILPIMIMPVDWLISCSANCITTVVKNGEPLTEFKKPKGKNVFIFGSEAFGIREEIQNHSDYHVSMILSKEMESINVSVFFGIFIHEMMSKNES